MDIVYYRTTDGILEVTQHEIIISASLVQRVRCINKARLISWIASDAQQCAVIVSPQIYASDKVFWIRHLPDPHLTFRSTMLLSLLGIRTGIVSQRVIGAGLATPYKRPLESLRRLCVIIQLHPCQLLSILDPELAFCTLLSDLIVSMPCNEIWQLNRGPTGILLGPTKVTLPNLRRWEHWISPPFWPSWDEGSACSPSRIALFSFVYREIRTLGHGQVLNILLSSALRPRQTLNIYLDTM